MQTDNIRQLAANITKDDVTCVAHRQNVTVLRSNIMFCKKARRAVVFNRNVE